jgi:hypothetical protein
VVGQGVQLHLVVLRPGHVIEVQVGQDDAVGEHVIGRVGHARAARAVASRDLGSTVRRHCGRQIPPERAPRVAILYQLVVPDHVAVKSQEKSTQKTTPRAISNVRILVVWRAVSVFPAFRLRPRAGEKPQRPPKTRLETADFRPRHEITITLMLVLMFMTRESGIR